MAWAAWMFSTRLNFVEGIRHTLAELVVEKRRYLNKASTGAAVEMRLLQIWGDLPALFGR